MKIHIRFIPLLLLLALTVVFASLGNWQFQRKIEKQELLNRFEQAQEMTLQQAINSDNDFARVRLLGNYESDWHVLLDNKIWRGQPGVHVLSLFYSKNEPAVLVDRGWLPMNPDRRILPEVMTPTGEMVIDGLLSKPPSGGVQLGEPDVISRLDGPVLLTYLHVDTIAKAAGMPIAPMILKLDATDDSGFADRDWEPAVILPAQHQAYAVQWYALALASIILIFTLAVQIRRGKP
jgi:surfeit locus 1 family protein